MVLFWSQLFFFCCYDGSNKRFRSNDVSLNMFEPAFDKGRFYILESQDPSVKLNSLNPSVIKKSIEKIFAEIDIGKTKKRRDGSLLLKGRNEIGNTAIRGLQKFNEIRVEVKDFSALNSSQGIIFCPDLMDTSCIEIQEGLSSQGVINVFKINKKGTTSPTALIILTFNGRSHPSSITIGYAVIEVRKYIQNPMRCQKCQKFGHTKKSCKEQEICGVCALPDNEHTECSVENCLICVEANGVKHYVCGPISCANCQGDHVSSDHSCPIFKSEFEINRLKVDRSLTYFEAKKVFEQTNSSQYSSVVEKNGAINNNTELNNIVAVLSKKLDNEIEVNKQRELKYESLLERQEQMIAKLEAVIKSKDSTIKNLEKKLCV